MKAWLLVLCLALPAAAKPLGYDDARHLLARTGFGITDGEVRQLARLSREEAVDRLLAGTLREATVAPPAFVHEAPLPYYKLREMSEEARRENQRRIVEEGFALREWWLREMLLTPSPLTERMTLFWHNHFATSQQKVRSNQLMHRQNALLRREALGNFATLLHAVSRDPAMLVYLDNANSRRQAPNENFAREVMELFTLGEGRYGEQDIKEAARAFTGWSLDRETLEFTQRRAWHDAGVKTVLGKTGRLDGDQVLDILLARPETAEFIVGKLWKEFVSSQPDPAAVRHLAGVFRERYEVKPLLRAMLLSEAFWAPAQRGALIRSPVELVVGTLHTFDIKPFSLRPAVLACALLGQNPLAPPNVKGWPGGDTWINAATLLGRKQLLERVFRGSDAMEAPMATMMVAADDPRPDPEARARRMMERGMQGMAFEPVRWSSKRAEPLASLLLPVPPVNVPPANLDLAERVRLLVADPAYQLK